MKRKLLRGIGCPVGDGTTIVGPIECKGTIAIGNQIGEECRRVGKGENYTQLVCSGTWIGGRVTILGNTQISMVVVIAGCACVVEDAPPNVLVVGTGKKYPELKK